MVTRMLALGYGLVISQIAIARTYFVDGQAGNDAWSGASALPAANGDGPWKTLRKASLTALLPGDTLALHCGDVWHEPLTLIRSGTAAQPIVVQAYGKACSSPPLIDAAIPLSNPARREDGSLSAKIDFTPGGVFLDGVYLAPARFPRDTDLISDGTNPSGKDFTTLPDDLSGRDLSGAEIYLRTEDWKIEERHLDKPADSRLVLDQPTTFPAGKGVRYHLTGKPWMLSYAGAWTFDAQTGELLLRPTAGAAMPKVEVARFDYGLQIAGAEHIRIEGLRITHSRLDGVRVVNSKNVELSGLAVSDSARDGVSIERSENVGILRSTIERSRHDGIAGVESTNLAVRGNRIEHSGIASPPADSPAAINMEQAGFVLVEANSVRDSGYIGIRFHRDARILDNTVESSCQVLSDCGAIYSWANNDPFPLASVVSGNRVVGTRADAADNAYLPYNSGIYLDDLSNGVVVKDNDVSHCDSGVHIHNGFNLRIEHNSLSDNRRNQIYFSFGHPTRDGSTLTGNLIDDNTLTYGPASLGVEIVSRYPDVRHGDFRRNHYRARGSRAVAYQTEPPGTETRPPQAYTLERWRSQRDQDMDGNSEQLPVPQLANGTFLLRSAFLFDVQGWDTWSPDKSGRMSWKPNCGGGVSGCMELSGGRQAVLAISPKFPLAPGQTCELRLISRNLQEDTSLQVRVRRSTRPYASAGLSTQILSGLDWTEIVLPFTAGTPGLDSGQIELKAGQGNRVQIEQLVLRCV